MTVSFHKYGEYFPGTGELRDIGVGEGKNYAVNFPLRDGITDRTYKNIFEPVIKAVMDYYKPEAVVLQCGGDSLSGDRLGCFNLSMRGHANCVNFVKSFNLPTLVLGGGGYTMRNVARTWAYETGQLVHQDMGAQLPYNDYYEYFAPDYELDVRPSNMENANSPDYLEKIKVQVIENLKRTAAVPSVQMQDVPSTSLMNGVDSDTEDRENDEDADANPDSRYTQRQWDNKVTRDDEFDESEDEEIASRNGVRRQPGTKRRRGIMDFQNPNAAPDFEPASGAASGLATPSPGRKSAASSVNGDVVMGEGSRAENAAIANAKADRALKAAEGSPAPGLAGDADAADEADAEDEADVVKDEDVDMDGAQAAGEDKPVEADAAKTLASPKPEETPVDPGNPPVEPDAVAPGTQPTADTAGLPAEDVEMAEGDLAVQKEEGLKDRQARDEAGEQEKVDEEKREGIA